MSVRWFNKRAFTALELEQVLFLRSTYQQCLQTDPLPLELQYDEDTNEPRCHPQRANFQKSFWLDRLGKGPLRPFAEQMLGLVCTFQERRADRTNPFKSGYPDDPVNLFCEELKGFLVNTVSKVEVWTGGERGDMPRVAARVRLLTLVEQGKLFPEEEDVEMSLTSLVVEVRMILEDKVVPKIYAEIATHTAREHCRVLIANATDVLASGCQVLVSIFRGANSVDQSYSLGSLVEPSRKEFDGILATESGRLLQVLESSPLFADVLLLKAGRVGTQDASLSRDTTVPNPFLGSTPADGAPGPEQEPAGSAPGTPLAQALPSAPSAVTNAATAAVAAVAATAPMVGKITLSTPPNEILRRLQTPRSGIETTFRGRPSALREFLDLHGWLYEIASLIVVFEQSRKLAGAGGSLLVYGPANSALHNLLMFMEAVLQRTKNYAEKLFESGNAEKLSLLRQNGGKTIWMANFAYSCSYKDSLIRSINSCVVSSGEVRVQAKKVSPGDRLEKAKKETERFLELVQGVLQRQAGLLNIPGFDSPKMARPRALEEGEHQEGRLHLTRSATSTSLATTLPGPAQPPEPLGVSVAPEVAGADPETDDASLSDSASIDEEALAKMEEEKLQWFLTLIRGDPFSGGSSYALTDEEAQLVHEQHQGQQKQQQGPAVAPKFTSTLQAQTSKAEPPKREMSLANLLASFSRSSPAIVTAPEPPPSSEPQTPGDPKKERPFAQAQKRLRERFAQGRRSLAHDPESKQALEEISKRKQELMIQERLQRVMSGSLHASSYELSEQERALIEVETMERSQLMQSEEEKLRALSAGSALAFGDSGLGGSGSGHLDEATAEALLQQKYAKFMMQMSQAPNQDFSLYTDSSAGEAGPEGANPVLDRDYESMAPVYDEATAQEIFNQKLALFQQQLTITPEREISSYTDVKEKERGEQLERQRKATRNPNLTIDTAQPPPLQDGEYRALAPSYDDATAQELFQQKFALFSQQMATTPDTEVSSYTDAADLSTHLEASVLALGAAAKTQTKRGAALTDGGVRKPAAPKAQRESAGSKTMKAESKSAVPLISGRPSRSRSMIEANATDDATDLFPETRRKLRFSGPDPQDDEDDEDEPDIPPPSSSDRKTSSGSWFMNLFSSSTSATPDKQQDQEEEPAVVLRARQPSSSGQQALRKQKLPKGASPAVLATSINGPDDDTDSTDDAPKPRSSTLFTWSPFADSKEEPKGSQPEVFSPAANVPRRRDTERGPEPALSDLEPRTPKKGETAQESGFFSGLLPWGNKDREAPPVTPPPKDADSPSFFGRFTSWSPFTSTPAEDSLKSMSSPTLHSGNGVGSLPPRSGSLSVSPIPPRHAVLPGFERRMPQRSPSLGLDSSRKSTRTSSSLRLPSDTFDDYDEDAQEFPDDVSFNSQGRPHTPPRTPDITVLGSTLVAPMTPAALAVPASTMTPRASKVEPELEEDDEVDGQEDRVPKGKEKAEFPPAIISTSPPAPRSHVPGQPRVWGQPQPDLFEAYQSAFYEPRKMPLRQGPPLAPPSVARPVVEVIDAKQPEPAGEKGGPPQQPAEEEKTWTNLFGILS